MDSPAVPPLGNPMFAAILPELKAFDPKLVENFWYDSGKQKYICKVKDGTFINLTLADVRRRLKKLGISARRDPLTELSFCDDAVDHIQNFQSVKWVGALAGYKCGMIEQHGTRVLVDSEAKEVEFQDGDYSVLEEYLNNMLGLDPRQLDTFLYWWRGVLFERAKPRQVIVIAGDAGCGKSLLQQLITYSLGGRSAKPYRYLTGRTEFNAELVGASHLVCDDEASGTDWRSRERLANELKQIVVGTEHRLHAKGRDAIMLSPRWTASISLNLEPESLEVLPIIDKSLADKIILLKAENHPMPMPTETEEQRKAFLEELTRGVRALFWYLREMEVPEEYASPRYVCCEYHHPEILRALRSISKEAELLDMIDTYLRPLPWEGSAATLDTLLRDYAPRRCDQLFNFRNACGSLLGRLSRDYPERVEKRRTSSSRGWTIKPCTEDDF